MINHPFTLEKRKKLVGERIKSIRTTNRYTQPAFGELVSPESPADKRVVYSWEQGKFLPSEERLKKIAQIGNISVEELKYGTYSDYIKGIFIYEDSLILNKDSVPTDMQVYLPKDKTEFTIKEYISYQPAYKSSKWYYGLFEQMNLDDKLVIVEHLVDNSTNTPHSNIGMILHFFNRSVSMVLEGNIGMLATLILDEFMLVEDVFFDEKRHSQELDKERQYSEEAMDELQKALESFKQKVTNIRDEYS